MPDFAVSTVFRGKDKISKNFRDMDKGAARFGRTAKKSFRDATASASRFRDVTKGILAAGAVSRGLGLLTRGLGSVTRQFIDFDKATIGAAARFKDIGPAAVDFEKQLKRIRDRAREAGATTEFTAAQSAEALNFLAKAGFSSAEAIGSLNSMINLATATGEDFATVADFSSDLLGSFGLNVDNTAQKIKNLARLNDVLVKASNTANVTVEDLFETMKDVGPIATGLGQSLESVTAVTAFLGGTGIKGSKAMTALKNAFLNLASPGTRAAGMLKALNVDVDDGTGNMRQLNDIIGDLAPQLDKMGNIKAAKVLDEIFGKRAIAGAINIGKGTEAIKAFEKSLLSASGSSEATAARLRKSLGNRLLALGSAATEFGFKIIEAFEVKGEGAIDRLTAAVRGFDATPIINGVQFTISAFKGLIAIISPLKEIIGVLIAGWVAYAAVMKIVAAAQAIVALTNPITLMVAAVAIGAGLLIKHWSDIGAGWSIMFDGMIKLWDKFKSGFDAFIDGFMLGIQIIDKAIFDTFAPLLNILDKARGFFGFGPEAQGDAERPAPQRTAPNQEEAAARREIGFEGRIQIAGAPEGTTVESETTGAPAIDFGLMGGS